MVSSNFTLLSTQWTTVNKYFIFVKFDVCNLTSSLLSHPGLFVCLLALISHQHSGFSSPGIIRFELCTKRVHATYRTCQMWFTLWWQQLLLWESLFLSFRPLQLCLMSQPSHTVSRLKEHHVLLTLFIWMCLDLMCVSAADKEKDSMQMIYAVIHVGVWICCCCYRPGSDAIWPPATELAGVYSQYSL